MKTERHLSLIYYYHCFFKAGQDGAASGSVVLKVEVGQPPLSHFPSPFVGALVTIFCTKDFCNHLTGSYKLTRLIHKVWTNALPYTFKHVASLVRKMCPLPGEQTHCWGDWSGAEQRCLSDQQTGAVAASQHSACHVLREETPNLRFFMHFNKHLTTVGENQYT